MNHPPRPPHAMFRSWAVGRVPPRGVPPPLDIGYSLLDIGYCAFGGRSLVDHTPPRPGSNLPIPNSSFLIAHSPPTAAPPPRHNSPLVSGAPFFHTMEKCFATFPHNGKNVSTLWKNGPVFSTQWKIFSPFFHTMEKCFPRYGKPRNPPPNEGLSRLQQPLRSRIMAA